MRKKSNLIKSHRDEMARQREYTAPFSLQLDHPGSEFYVDSLGDSGSRGWTRVIVSVGKRDIVFMMIDAELARSLAKRILESNEP